MKCAKCGYESNDNFEICPKCNNDINRENEKDDLSILSFASLIVTGIYGFNLLTGTHFLDNIIWAVIAFILALISFLTFKDKMSKILLIINELIISFTISVFSFLIGLILAIFMQLWR